MADCYQLDVTGGLVVDKAVVGVSCVGEAALWAEAHSVCVYGDTGLDRVVGEVRAWSLGAGGVWSVGTRTESLCRCVEDGFDPLLVWDALTGESGDAAVCAWRDSVAAYEVWDEDVSARAVLELLFLLAGGGGEGSPGVGVGIGSGSGAGGEGLSVENDSDDSCDDGGGSDVGEPPGSSGDEGQEDDGEHGESDSGEGGDESSSSNASAPSGDSDGEWDDDWGGDDSGGERLGAGDVAPRVDAEAGKRARESAAMERNIARRVFRVRRDDYLDWRQPTSSERVLRASVSRALKSATLTSRRRVVTRSLLPPGRVDGRAALARAAGESLGFRSEVPVFRRTERKRTPLPDYRVGVVVDVTASMSEMWEETMGVAWAFENAVRDVEGRFACAAFGPGVYGVCKPGIPSKGVGVPVRRRGRRRAMMSHDMSRGVQAVANMVGMRDDGVRVLVVVSDGEFPQEDRKKAISTVGDLRRCGVRCVWMGGVDRSLALQYGASASSGELGEVLGRMLAV